MSAHARDIERRGRDKLLASTTTVEPAYLEVDLGRGTDL